jgi:hypothetical protein
MPRPAPVAHPGEIRELRLQLQFFTDVFGKEAQHEIAVLLKQQILAPVAALGDWPSSRCR